MKILLTFLAILLILFRPSVANSITWIIGFILAMVPIIYLIIFIVDFCRYGESNPLDKSTKKDLIGVIPILIILFIVGFILMGQG